VRHFGEARPRSCVALVPCSRLRLEPDLFSFLASNASGHSKRAYISVFNRRAVRRNSQLLLLQ
jgi:hypothetical protein